MAQNVDGLYAIREQLNAKGIDNNRINYNNQTGYVTIDNQNFIKPQTLQQGRSYTDANSFNNAYQNFNVNNQLNTMQQSVQQPQVNQYDNRVNDLLNQITQRSNTPSTYNPYQSAEYAAYQAQAQRQAQQATRSAQESLGAAGLGRSTILSDRAQGIQNDANEYMNTQVLPQLIAANQQREQQELNNLYNILGALQSQQSLTDSRQQQSLGNQFDIINALTNRQQLDVGQQQADRNYQLQMSELTGYLPNGQATTTEQQRQLSNLWAVADATGAIPNELADVYGLPRGTQTQAAKEFAQQIAIQRQNANTSAYSAQTSRLNQQLGEREFAYRQEQDTADRQAAAAQTSTKPSNYSYKSDPEFASAIKALNTNFDGNSQLLLSDPDRFINEFTYDGYLELLKIVENKSNNNRR